MHSLLQCGNHRAHEHLQRGRHGPGDGILRGKGPRRRHRLRSYARPAFGVANAGDLLVFEIWNQTLNSIFASEPDLSADGQNHAYATQFSGGIINGFDFPAGTYVGMEDLPDGQSDWNYQDDQFVATNVAIVPEPGSLLVLGSGILTVAGFTRRRLF
jgi:hypothetical protein